LMYLDYNKVQIHLLFNESKKYTFTYICGRRKSFILIFIFLTIVPNHRLA
jgi:hypothetical protein